MRWLALGCLLWAAAPAMAADDLDGLEARVDETIRSACHGYLVDALPTSLDWLKAHLYADSPLCRTVQRLPEDVPAGRALGPSGYRTDAAGYAMYAEQTMDMDMDCRYEWMCIHVRSRHKTAKDPVRQHEYDAVRMHCRGDYGCIERFFDNWPQPLPRTQYQSSVSLTALVEGNAAPAMPSAAQGVTPHPAESTAAARGASLSELMAATATTQAPAAAPRPGAPRPGGTDRGVGLGDVFAARDSKDLADLSASIARMNADLFANCQCSLSDRGCYSEVLPAARGGVAEVAATRRSLCADWRRNFGGRQFDSLTAARQARAAVDSLSGQLDQLDQRAGMLIEQAQREEQQRIADQRAQAEQARQSSGFQWGKFAALGIGAVAGGITSLDASSQVDIMTAIVADSMAGNDGVDNLSRVTEEATAARQAQASSTSAAADGGGSGPPAIDEDFTFECPATKKSHTVPIQADTQACADAMKAYARAGSCNLVDEMQAAGQAYQRACASEIY